MKLLVIFTSEEAAIEEILKILGDKGIQRGVVLESQGMRKALRSVDAFESIFGILEEKRPFNKTILAIIEKENVKETIRAINSFWKDDKEKEKKKNRVMFTLPLEDFSVGISA